ncbi:uncharacterized protein [Physcomitrium patens]|uniref:uncharacterized protein isoform X5 n=1 Tax=Physcomitrium patens TaxID=3218 RepID=UPI003CCDC0DE
MRFWKKACYLQIFLLLTTRKHGDRYQSWAGCDTSPEIDRGHWRDAYKIRFEFRCATTLHLVTAAGQHIPRLLELGMQQHNHGTAGK